MIRSVDTRFSKRELELARLNLTDDDARQRHSQYLSTYNARIPKVYLCGVQIKTRLIVSVALPILGTMMPRILMFWFNVV